MRSKWRRLASNLASAPGLCADDGPVALVVVDVVDGGEFGNEALELALVEDVAVSLEDRRVLGRVVVGVGRRGPRGRRVPVGPVLAEVERDEDVGRSERVAGPRPAVALVPGPGVEEGPAAGPEDPQRLRNAPAPPGGRRYVMKDRDVDRDVRDGRPPREPERVADGRVVVGFRGAPPGGDLDEGLGDVDRDAYDGNKLFKIPSTRVLSERIPRFFFSRRELGKRGSTVQEPWKTSSI